MLKPIQRVACSPALAACQRLIRIFALWLCEPATTAESITQAALQPPGIPTSAIEADWLWGFLQRLEMGTALLDRAQIVAGMNAQNKTTLQGWLQAVSGLPDQFQANPPAWPVDIPRIPAPAWKAFKSLMQAFYEKGLRSGLPYLPDGTPVAAGGVTYADFVQAFREAHKLNPAPNAREVCVLCGDRLGQTPEVDHWVAKGEIPVLSVCAENLLPICGECNSTANKGEKAVHSAGSFADWFHPFFRPVNGGLSLSYSLPEFAVTCTTAHAGDQAKVNNLDRLLNLTDRWTREFKAEYATKQRELARSRQRGRGPNDRRALQAWLTDYRDGLVDSEPNYEVHQVLAAAMLDPARLASWGTELGLVA